MGINNKLMSEKITEDENNLDESNQNIPNIQPVGDNTLPQNIQPVGGNTLPQNTSRNIQPVGGNTLPQIQPIGANTLPEDN